MRYRVDNIDDQFTCNAVTLSVANLKRDSIFTGKVSSWCINIGTIRVNHYRTTLIGGHSCRRGNRAAAAITDDQLITGIGDVIN